MNSTVEVYIPRFNTPVLLDIDDFISINRCRKVDTCIYAVFCGNDYYAGFTYCDGSGRHIHRFIMKPPDSSYVDHKNRLTFDNRQNNLRVCNHSCSNMNRSKRSTPSSSKFKGVSYFKLTSKWRAQIMINKKTIHLGYFKSEEEAALAYNIGAVEYHGKFAKLNIINSASH